MPSRRRRSTTSARARARSWPGCGRDLAPPSGARQPPGCDRRHIERGPPLKAAMTFHPKERRGQTRRDLLARAGGTALGLSGAGSLLAACANSTTPTGASTGASGQPVGPGGLPLARPYRRVTMPRWEQPIASGLKPETGGTFNVYNYPDYLYTPLLKKFCAKYNVTPRSRR